MADIIKDTTAVWANSAGANTAVNVDISDAEAGPSGDSVIVVYNPSTVTALTVRVYDTEALGGADRHAERTTFNVAANSSESLAVDNWPVGPARVSLSNDTVLGAGDGFTAYLRVRKGRR